VLQIAEAGLSIAIWIAVLAFGGTSPPFFFVISNHSWLGVLFLSARLRRAFAAIHLPLLAPLSLVALVLLQILQSLLFRIAGRVIAECLAAIPYTFSVAPYQKVSHLLLLVTYLTAFYLVSVGVRTQRCKEALFTPLLRWRVRGFLRFGAVSDRVPADFCLCEEVLPEDATGTYINRNHFAGLFGNGAARYGSPWFASWPATAPCQLSAAKAKAAADPCLSRCRNARQVCTRHFLRHRLTHGISPRLCSLR